MRTSIPRRSRSAASAAFTLVELLVAVGLSGAVLAGILTTSVQLMRNNVRIAHYSEMDTQVRRAFEQLGTDLKSAKSLKWNGASDITVTIPRSNGTTSEFTYCWSSTSLSFFRVPGSSSASTSQRIELIRGIPARPDGGPGLSFSRLTASGTAATTDLATKRIEVSATVSRSATGAARATSAVSATFTLRNKPAS
ncbi:type II secretion system protein J [Horticoccus sp. 23ND18S-11]|uniref:type II secretion system protein J n=1 Tax=Horticoccus sp. 23ND18S-11 TaxID=3391832 RepID=UPI0039C9DDC1